MKIFDMKKIFLTVTLLLVSGLTTADIIKNQVEFLSPDDAFQPSVKIITNNYLEVTWDIEEGIISIWVCLSFQLIVQI